MHIFNGEITIWDIPEISFVQISVLFGVLEFKEGYCVCECVLFSSRYVNKRANSQPGMMPSGPFKKQNEAQCCF